MLRPQHRTQDAAKKPEHQLLPDRAASRAKHPPTDVDAVCYGHSWKWNSGNAPLARTLSRGEETLQLRKSPSVFVLPREHRLSKAFVCFSSGASRFCTRQVFLFFLKKVNLTLNLCTNHQIINRVVLLNRVGFISFTNQICT